jgi:hypothetical protein
LDKVEFDLESPLFRKACHNLGIEIEDCKKRNVEFFKEKGVDKEVVELRFNHFKGRLFQTIN